ncbi:hypothetical protein BCV70DRAFT_217068 [Testicularia cyperi]|uniref:Transmembrane protein n=1 Tax=Testicularia cyperi TaxID=1882483 RepID=A0A317XRV5_9BASI|nr:hypothetical protein BCV70DRAFT_217068 [Testicularia cyperi]
MAANTQVQALPSEMLSAPALVGPRVTTRQRLTSLLVLAVHASVLVLSVSVLLTPNHLFGSQTGLAVIRINGTALDLYYSSVVGRADNSSSSSSLRSQGSTVGSMTSSVPTLTDSDSGSSTAKSSSTSTSAAANSSVPTTSATREAGTEADSTTALDAAGTANANTTTSSEAAPTRTISPVLFAAKLPTNSSNPTSLERRSGGLKKGPRRLTHAF